MNILEKLGGATRTNLTIMIAALSLLNFAALAMVWFKPDVGVEIFKITFTLFTAVITGIVTYFYTKSKEETAKPVVENKELLG